MNIKNLNKAEILAALYNNSKPQGLGYLEADSENMTKDEARELLDRGTMYFDYLKGRVMKIDLSRDELDTWLYNRDNGEGAAEKVIEAIPV